MATELINSASDEYVHSLLSADHNLVYVIPKYQREYSWSKYQWEDLLQDLQEEDAGQGHFLGTIICINMTSDAVKEVKLELVDGQQRMTTLSILLATLYARLHRFEDLIEADDDLHQKLLNLRSRVVKSDQPRIRLQTQGGNAADYEWLLTSVGLLKRPGLKSPNYWGNRRLARAYAYFNDALAKQLENMTDDEQVTRLFDLVDRTSNAILVKLEVKNHASAFTLFESLNNRGLELSPIDLIKNSLLARADKESETKVDEVYDRWLNILRDLGPSAVEQERFLRYYYNAFEPVPKEAIAAPIATRSNLIRLYEEYLTLGIDQFLEDLATAAHEYGRIIDTVEDEDEDGPLDRITTRLQRAQGAPGNALLLYLLVNREPLAISEADVTHVADSLVRFFVRRNLTGFPATYELPRMFKSVIREIAGMRGSAVVTAIDEVLRQRSIGDEAFIHALEGPVYTENSDMVRFILTSLAEEAQTNENHIDLWERAGKASKRYYVWTIEHIFPQGENIPEAWVSMMGGPVAAKQALESHVHRLGNLTLTGYNSTLGAKSFQEKRDRVDHKGRPVGYKNQLVLNRDLQDADTWSTEQIDARTTALVREIVDLFKLR